MLRLNKYSTDVGELARTFGDALNAVMLSKGLAPEDFEDLRICSAGQIRSYIRCEHAPSIGSAVKIAEFLNVSLDWMCGLSNDQEVANPPMFSRKAPWL